MRFIFLLFSLSYSVYSLGQIKLRSVSASDAVNDVFVADNSGVRVDNVYFVGASEAMACFSLKTLFLPISKGLVLTTGDVHLISKANSTPNAGLENFAQGDRELSSIAKGETFDAAILSFDFYPNTENITFNYFFASEEYPEFVNKGVNDVFAFFIRKKGTQEYTNIALLPNSQKPVTVDNVNASNHANLFIENDLWSIDNIANYADDIPRGERALFFAFDGLTQLLTANYEVVPYEAYEFKIAIADVGDPIFDSGVFLQQNSFRSTGKQLALNELIADSLVVGIDEEIKITASNEANEFSFDIPFKFDFNSTQYSQAYDKLLNDLTTLLSKYFDLNIRLIGHSDAVGDEPYNIILSENRAKKVADDLVDRGINSQRITIKGVGSTELVSEKNQQENRRVSCILFR